MGKILIVFDLRNFILVFKNFFLQAEKGSQVSRRRSLEALCVYGDFEA